jgi:hemoglobin/transferrin/lactoferrin receptor protein
MKKFICLAALSLLSLGLNGQNLLIYDTEEGQPLERATISISADQLSSLTTNDQGLVNISAFKGEKEIRIYSLGYIPQTYNYAELSALDFSIGLKSEALALDQVVVSATRWSQSSRELPFNIKTLKTKDIYFNNPQTSADLLSSSGEVFVQKSQQGGGSPMIRGFATNRLLIAVDGIRMNNAIFRSGNMQQVISLDPFAIERTEIYFGPGSVIYGSDAIGGVMSFSTLKPQLSKDTTTLVKGSAYSRFSSANQERSQHFDINVGGQKWAYRASLSYSNYGDLRMGTNGSDQLLRPWSVQRLDSVDRVVRNKDPELQLNTAFEQFNTLQKLLYKPNAHWDIEYAFHYSTTSNYDRYDRLIRTQNDVPRAAEWFYGPQVWMMNKVELNYRERTKLADKITLRLAQQNFEESRNDRDFQSTKLFHKVEKVAAYSLNLDLLKRLSLRHKIFYGIEAVYNNVRSNGTVEDIFTGTISNAANRYPQANWQSYAAYLNHEWELNEKFTSQLGLRYNQFMVNSDFSDNLDFYPLDFSESSLNTGNLTGSLGFVYRPSEDWKWRLNFGTAFRAPNVDDIGKVFDSGDAIVVVPNPDLKAENAYNAEFGIATLLGKSLKLDLSAYYTYLDQALVRRPFLLNGEDSISYNGELSQVQAVQNAARASVYGFQLGLDWQIDDRFVLRNQFNWQKGEEEDQDENVSPSRHAAPLFGISRLGFEQKQLRLELNVQYSGAVQADDLNFEEQGKAHIYQVNAAGEVFSPAWYTLNFKSSYQIDKTWSINAGVENLTDQRYRPYSSGLVAAGRNFVMGVKGQF